MRTVRLTDQTSRLEVTEPNRTASVEESPLDHLGPSLRRSLGIAADFEAALGPQEARYTDGAAIRAIGAIGPAVEAPPVVAGREIRHQIGPEEAAIYEGAGLRTEEVAGRECLVRDDIDWDQVDSSGRTNAERAAQGLAPLDAAGRTYELHHVGQEADGVLAELTTDEHRSADNYEILHDPGRSSEIDREAFAEQRAEHWKARAPKGGGS